MEQRTNSSKDSAPATESPGWRVPTAAAALFLAAFAMAVAFVFAFPLPSIENDAREYLAIALNISEGIGFSNDGSSPTAYRPPVFSILLGGWFKLTGTSSLLSTGIFQSLVHALGVVTAFFLFLELRVRFWWACGAGLFLALTPLLVTRAVFVLQEPTVLLFTTLAVLASVRLIKAPSRFRAALTGAAWGICVLSKISSWFAPFLLLAMSLAPTKVRWTWRPVQGAILLLCFVSVVTPWALRNYVHFQRFIPVNDQGVGMLEWNIQQTNVPGQQPGEKILAHIKRTWATQSERKDAMWQFVLQHPRYFLFDRSLRNAIYFAAPSRDWWIQTGRIELGSSRAIFWLLVAIFHLPLYVFLLYRSWQLIVGRLEPAQSFVILLYWVYWAEHILVWGDPRFGLAVYPLLVALALPKRPADNDSRNVAAG